jgi:hypothetical protein
MNAEQLQAYISGKAIPEASAQAEIEALAAAYPWFSTPYLLLAMCQNTGTLAATSKILTKAALYSPDWRVVLCIAQKIDHLATSKQSQTENTEILQIDESTPIAAVNGDERFASSNLLKTELLELENGQAPPETTPQTETLEQTKPRATRKVANDYFSEELLGTEPEENKDDLIESFIKNRPSMPKLVVPKPGKENVDAVPTQDISSGSIFDDEELVTETLAQIYVEQGFYQKAIRAYEKLSLKYPEKSTYFATQIQEIKKLNT